MPEARERTALVSRSLPEGQRGADAGYVDRDGWKISASLSEEEQAAMVALLEEYQDVFAKDNEDITGYVGVDGPFEIPLTDEKPTFEKQRKLSARDHGHARTVARENAATLVVAQPALIDPDALEGAWDTWQKVEEILTDEGRLQLDWLKRESGGASLLVMAGWPCQDLSDAGKKEGLKGKHSSQYATMKEALERMAGQWQNDMGYVVENVAFQFAWAHKEQRTKEYQEVCKDLGRPVVTDAALLGSAARRVRNVWTNLCECGTLQAAIDGAGKAKWAKTFGECVPGAQVPESKTNRHPNRAGEATVAAPTITATRGSYAYREGGAGRCSWLVVSKQAGGWRHFLRHDHPRPAAWIPLNISRHQPGWGVQVHERPGNGEATRELGATPRTSRGVATAVTPGEGE
ncbi:hypothetical protein RI054_03g15290 [Pseudoscourfieldia marina]